MSEKVRPEDVDLEAMKKDIDKLVQSNNDKLNGIGATIDPYMFSQLKIEVFIDTFLDENAKIIFAFNLQTRIKQMLDEDLRRVRQEQLLDGVPGIANKLKLPGK